MACRPDGKGGFTPRALAAVAAFVTGGLPSLALAQDAPPPAGGLTPDEVEAVRQSQVTIELVEGWFREAERARQAGDCAQRTRELNLIFSGLSLPASSIPAPLLQSLRDDWRRRYQEALSLPCPPRAAQPPPPVNAAPSAAAPALSLRDQATNANLAHALATDRCDAAEAARQLRIVEDLERRANEALQRVRMAEFAVDRVDSPAVRQAAADFGEIALIRETMIARPLNCRPRHRFGFRAIGRYGETYVPSVGLGFSGQQQETYATQSQRDVETGGVRATLDTPVGDFPLRFWGQYEWGNRSTGFDLPSTNQAQFGAVYTAPSPSGTSGVQLQLFGMSGETGVRLRDYQVGVEFPFRTAESEAPRPVDRTFFAYTYYDRLERTHTGSLHAEANLFNTNFFFDQERRQQLDENYFAAGLGGRLEHSIAPGWLFELAARAGPYYRDSALESVEHVRSNVVPAADQDFTTVIADDDGGLGVDGELLFGVEHALLPDISLYLGGAVGYRSSVGAIFNPSSSEQLLDQGRTTGIEGDDLYWWGLRAGIVIPFGR